MMIFSLSGPVFAPEGGELVLQDGHYGFGCGDLGPEAEQEQHQEEEDGPDRGHRHPGHSLGVRDEGEPRAVSHNIL